MEKAQSYNEKKWEEKKVADFFISHFNCYHKKNYRTKINEDEYVKNEDVDVYAVSDDCDTLYLQIKTNEPELEGFYGRARKHGRTRFGDVFVNIKESICKMIKDGEKQYSTRGNLIFIISERISPATFDKEYARLISNECGNSEFKGVYLVKLPIGSGENHPYEGQIVAIKDIYGKSGGIF